MTDEKKISILKDIIKIDTSDGNEKKVVDYFTTLLNRKGFKIEKVKYNENREQLIVTLEGYKKGKILGYSGHMDVVPVGNIEWEYPPFDAVQEDDKIYGRGTCDMKAGLTAMLIAMMELKELEIPFTGSIKLLATVGEETSGIGAEQLTKLGYADDLDALIISEPTNMKVTIAHKGALWTRFKTFGKTAHGSMPSEGINAIEHMRVLMDEFDKRFDFSLIKDEFVGDSSSSLNFINAGKATNVIPDECVTEYDIRTIAKQNHEEIKLSFTELLNDLTGKIPDFKASVEYINDLNPVNTDADDQFVHLTLDTIKELYNTIPEVNGLSGYTDASQFTKTKKKFPVIIFGPGITELAHQPNEYIEISKYLKSIEIYKKLAVNYLNSEMN